MYSHTCGNRILTSSIVSRRVQGARTPRPPHDNEPTNIVCQSASINNMVVMGKSCEPTDVKDVAKQLQPGGRRFFANFIGQIRIWNSVNGGTLIRIATIIVWLRLIRAYVKNARRFGRFSSNLSSRSSWITFLTSKYTLGLRWMIAEPEARCALSESVELLPASLFSLPSALR